MKRIRTVKSSNLPISIKNEAHHFPNTGISENEKAGPNSPNAGPTFPRLEAATPIDEVKSSPIKEKISAPIINEIM